MADAQENFRGLSQRVFDAVGPNLNPRVSTTDRGEAHIMSNTLAALLDRLDEAKRLHEVERDRANDLLVERDVAERECASLRGVVDRLRTSMLHISGIPEVSINCGIGDGSTPAAVEALAGMFRTAERERDEARAEVERQKGIVSDALKQHVLTKNASQREQARANAAEIRVADLEAEVERLRRIIAQAAEHVVQCESLPPWEGGLDAGVGAMRQRIAELEAEVERLRKERADTERTAVYASLSANKALDRVAELEKAARGVRRACLGVAMPPDLLAAVIHMTKVAEHVVTGSSAPDPDDSGDQRPCFDTLDDVALAMSGVLERLARLEARNG